MPTSTFGATSWDVNTSISTTTFGATSWDVSTPNGSTTFWEMNGEIEAWLDVIYVPGPIGPQWTQGIQGEIWPSWPQWIQWETWLQGIQWIQGIQGIQGLTGDTWPQWIQWIQWNTGLTGDTWPQGIQGIQGIQWNPWVDGDSFIFEWAYSWVTTYQVNDVVSYNGSSYICILVSTWNLPTNVTYWSIIAQKGADGAWAGDMLKSDNLSGLANNVTARSNIGLWNVDNTSDANKPVSTAQASADTATLNSAKTYADWLVVSLLDDRWSSVNTFPASGWSGTAWAILKGDMWFISIAGTLWGVAVEVWDSLRALVDTPGQTTGNWSIIQVNINYVPENAANKSTTLSTDQASNTKFPSVKSVYDWATGLFATITNLALKAPINNPTFTGTVWWITAAMVWAPSWSGTCSNTNSGDQSSIVWISWTIAQFNAACTDADFAPLVDIFNNYWQLHATYNDFNSINKYWPTFVMWTTNWPGHSWATNYYVLSEWLGTDYDYSQYVMQMAIPRNATSPSIYIRYREAGTWGSWKAIGWSGESIEVSLLAGETIAIGDAVRKWIVTGEVTEVNITIGPNATQLWYDTWMVKIGQSFTVVNSTISSVTVYLSKQWTPTWNITCKIYSWTGTWLLATSTNTISESSLTASEVAYTFTFNNDYIWAWTRYLELSVDRAVSSVNFSRPWYSGVADYYPWHTWYSINSWWAWQWNPYDLKFSVNTRAFYEDTSKIFKASALDFYKSGFIWFAKTGNTVWNPVITALEWVSNIHSWLTVWAKYFLTDTLWTISTTKWTKSVYVGTALSATSILINKPERRFIVNDSFSTFTTKTYSHWLWRVPNWIRIYSVWWVTSTTVSCHTTWIYDWNTYTLNGMYHDGSNFQVNQSTTKIINNSYSTNTFSATVTTFDAEKIVLTWTWTFSYTAWVMIEIW